MLTQKLRQLLRKFTTGFIVLAVIAGFFAPAEGVWAATYETLVVSGGGSLTMAPGEKKMVQVEFLNRSDFTWKNDGPGYISLYTHAPKYRKSVFDPGTWLSGTQVKRIREASVKKGEKATMSFELRAPTTPGTYTEVFKLASESRAWFETGEVKYTITVKEKTVETTPAPVAVVKPKAEITAMTADRVKLTAGKSVFFTVAVKNTGTTTWNSTSLGTVAKVETPVKPGEVATLSFRLKAPETNGTHKVAYTLEVDGSAVEGTVVEIPVEVTGGAGEVANTPVDPSVESSDTANYVEEPMMRIAFLIVDEETDNEVVITSNESAFTVTDLSGAVLAERAVGQTVRAWYTNGTYYYEVDGATSSVSGGIRFVPSTANAVMLVKNFDRRLTRNAKFADNEYRNILELRHNDHKDRTWLINELPLEWYLRGLAETSNASPIEYQKALITSARTYAYYHYTHATKYKKEFFHISSYSWDQVYNGYGQEKRAPKITEAVEATRGLVVTYEGDLAVTPYFSRSDGRTRDWNEVWSGSVPWAKSVEVPCDKGKTLWGHGVGLSASGAICFANEGMTGEQILKHFFTGIELTKKWK